MENTENSNQLSETKDQELVQKDTNREPNTAIRKRPLERYKLNFRTPKKTLKA